MINIVCWLWGQPDDALHPRKQMRFGPEHVNTLYSMLNRHIRCAWRLTCITDRPQGIRQEVRCLPLWDDLRHMGGCFTRLKAFSVSMADIIGPDFFSIDLDVVITADITQLLQDTINAHDFKIWGDTNPTTPYNGSFFYMKAGARRQVWDKFDPKVSPALARQRKYYGTDQAWIGYALGPHEAKWGLADGVYSFRVHFQEGRRRVLTGNEKIVFFHGCNDPSKPETIAVAPWVARHWR